MSTVGRLSSMALSAVLTLAGGPGCGGDGVELPTQSHATDIAVTAVHPDKLVPGSLVVVEGGSFVPDFGGASYLRLRGTLDGAEVDVRLSAAFVDYNRLDVAWPGGRAAGFPADEGMFAGEAIVEAKSSFDGLEHRSVPFAVSFDVRRELAPRLDVLQNAVLFVNDPVVAEGEDFLLGGDEGRTIAVVEGCFTEEGATDCLPVGPTEVASAPVEPFDRTRVSFPFSPHIAGIRPGSFTGTVRLVNRHGALAGGVEHATESVATANDIVEPAIFTISPPTASLGQYVDVTGGGFVGVPAGEQDSVWSVTLLELEGSFTPEGGTAQPASVTLVPEFVSGQLVRYVLNEEDALGQSVDLRKSAGTFEGVVRPVVEFGSDVVIGSDTPASLGFSHVKQVVWLHFLPTYVESLRHFGLRAVEPLVRARVFEAVRRDYAGVNIEFRESRPDDFALFSEVEIGGPDPNGIGLLGYDNTPGKDVGNERLHDKIGGVNALTQLDGYPGYGGVFVESLFSFSQHPNGLAPDLESGDPTFDALFDAFRPDVQGTPVAASEVEAVPVLASAEMCPAGDRPAAIGCAVWALGSLVGTTVSHEVAHSLGLADPGGENFHNTGDWPEAIMDAGGARSFLERAEIGQGPGVFCRRNYDYLRQILRTSEPDPLPSRVECY